MSAKPSNEVHQFKGVNCYESKEGKLILYACEDEEFADGIEVIVEHHDLLRLLYAVGDALVKMNSRR